MRPEYLSLSNFQFGFSIPGVTFDSGGISIKPSPDMDKMRADMGGAACVVSALVAIATLGLPINVSVVTPLCENLLSGEAYKPGDVVKAMNGKTIQVSIKSL